MIPSAPGMFGGVAIVHDWLTSMRGGEQVVEALCELFPDADLFTLRCDRARLSPALARRKMTTSFIDRIARTPLVGGRFRSLLPLFPRAVEAFRLDRYQLVISSSHCVALGAIAPPDAVHLAYVHSPMRYIREAQTTYEAAVPAPGRWLFRALAGYLRRWDDRAAARPHRLIANSRYTRDRIQRYYGRQADVVPPPVDTTRFARTPGQAAQDPEAPFLVVSALVPSKRVELAVRAFAGRPDRLLVVGEGPEQQRLQALAGSNVSFLGWVSDERLVELYRGCRALVHPGVDDFGMVMVEALAAGKPVLAANQGGALEILGTTEALGILFEPSVAGIRDALDRLPHLAPRLEPPRLQMHAQRYDRARFREDFLAIVRRAFAARQPAPQERQVA